MFSAYLGQVERVKAARAGETKDPPPESPVGPGWSYGMNSFQGLNADNTAFSSFQRFLPQNAVPAYPSLSMENHSLMYQRFPPFSRDIGFSSMQSLSSFHMRSSSELPHAGRSSQSAIQDPNLNFSNFITPSATVTKSNPVLSETEARIARRMKQIDRKKMLPGYKPASGLVEHDRPSTPDARAAVSEGEFKKLLSRWRESVISYSSRT